MSEIELVACDLCGGLIDGDYRHMQVDTDFEKAHLEHARPDVVDQYPGQTVASDVVVDIGVVADERVSLDVCAECLEAGAAAAYDQFVEELRSVSARQGVQ